MSQAYQSGYDEPKKDGLYECLVYIIDVPGHHKVNRKYTVKKGWDLMGLENVIAWRGKEMTTGNMPLDMAQESVGALPEICKSCKNRATCTVHHCEGYEKEDKFSEFIDNLERELDPNKSK